MRIINKNNFVLMNWLEDKLNFEQLKNFPLTMKYMNNYQKEKCWSMINSIKNLISTLEKFKENLKSVDENAK